MRAAEPTNLDQARDVVAASQWDGVTYKELLASGKFDGEGHGSASGALTRLHADGVLARLTEKRARCAVYVLPKYLAGRDHEPYRSYSREARSDTRKMEVPWVLLARLSACTCACDCGAREGLVAEPGAENALMRSFPLDRPVEVSDEERLLMENDPRLTDM